MLSFAVSTLTTLFLVVDPPAAAPLVVAMTARDTDGARAVFPGLA